MVKLPTTWLPGRKAPGQLTIGEADTRVTADGSTRVTASGDTRVTSDTMYTPKPTTEWTDGQ